MQPGGGASPETQQPARAGRPLLAHGKTCRGRESLPAGARGAATRSGAAAPPHSRIGGGLGDGLSGAGQVRAQRAPPAPSPGDPSAPGSPTTGNVSWPGVCWEPPSPVSDTSPPPDRYFSPDTREWPPEKTVSPPPTSTTFTAPKNPSANSIYQDWGKPLELARWK